MLLHRRILLYFYMILQPVLFMFFTHWIFVKVLAGFIAENYKFGWWGCVIVLLALLLPFVVAAKTEKYVNWLTFILLHVVAYLVAMYFQEYMPDWGSFWEMFYVTDCIRLSCMVLLLTQILARISAFCFYKVFNISSIF